MKSYLSTKNQNKKRPLKAIAFIASLAIFVVALTPTLTAIAMPDLPSTVCVWGDVNNDGTVDASDASIVLETYSMLSTGQITGLDVKKDINFDETVDSSDASLILEQYARVSTGKLEKYLDSEGVFVIIPEGRTFSGIAVDEKMSMDALEKLNPQIVDFNNLKAGTDKIYVLRRPDFFEKENVTTTTTSTVTTTFSSTTTPITTTITTKNVVTATVPTTVTTTMAKTTVMQNTSTTLSKTPTIKTEPVSDFIIDNRYMLSDIASSWVLYPTSELSNASNWLQSGDILEVKDVVVAGWIYKVELDGTTYYIDVKPERYSNWVHVVESNLITTTTVATVKTETISAFENGGTYMLLSPPAKNWYLYKDKGLSLYTPELGAGELLTNVKYTDVDNVYQGTRNGEICYFRVSPHNFSNWAKVVNSAGSTTIVAPVTTEVTTTIKKWCVYDDGWNIRSSQTTATADNIIATLPYDEYVVSKVDGGWEYINYKGITGWIYTADYPEYFLYETPVTTKATTTKSTTTSKPGTTTVVPYEGSLPQSVLDVIATVQKQYPGCKISASVSDITGKRVYSFNGYSQLFAGCSFKAAFSTYVFETCEQQGINIDTVKLEYRYGMKNTGCGNLQYEPYGSWWTIDYLEDQCIRISDNTCYNVLRQKFTMAGFKAWLNRVGGQQIIWEPDVLYGSASSRERVNEWVAIYRYITSGTNYANRLKNDLCNAYPRFYDVSGPHKSGSCDDPAYTCASDCGIVYDYDGTPYIIAVIVQDAVNEWHSSQAVKKIANNIIYWANSNNIF